MKAEIRREPADRPCVECDGLGARLIAVRDRSPWMDIRSMRPVKIDGEPYWRGPCPRCHGWGSTRPRSLPPRLRRSEAGSLTPLGPGA